METTKKQIIYYTTIDGKCPFTDWISTLDPSTQKIILARVDRLLDGLKGDWKRLKNSKLSELRINYGEGYRIYYRDLSDVIIIILSGSNKKNQDRTIAQADTYLKELKERKPKK